MRGSSTRATVYVLSYGADLKRKKARPENIWESRLIGIYDGNCVHFVLFVSLSQKIVLRTERIHWSLSCKMWFLRHQQADNMLRSAMYSETLWRGRLKDTAWCSLITASECKHGAKLGFFCFSDIYVLTAVTCCVWSSCWSMTLATPVSPTTLSSSLLRTLEARLHTSARVERAAGFMLRFSRQSKQSICRGRVENVGWLLSHCVEVMEYSEVGGHTAWYR